jgi:hypothetical protein
MYTSVPSSRLLLATVALALAGIGFTLAGQASAARPATTSESPGTTAQVRIGVYDTRAIGLAYGRSDAATREIENLRAEHRKAVDAGDQARAAELEKQGASRQIRMHLQVFSNAPVDDALDSVRAELRHVAQRMNVCAIVSSMAFEDQDVEAVDVTDEMVKLFHPTEQTLKLIADCRKQKPLPIEQVAQLPADK